MIPLMGNVQNWQIHSQRRLGLPGALGEVNGESQLVGPGFFQEIRTF